MGKAQSKLGCGRFVRDTPNQKWVRISALSILHMVLGPDHFSTDQF